MSEEWPIILASMNVSVLTHKVALTALQDPSLQQLRQDQGLPANDKPAMMAVSFFSDKTLVSCIQLFRWWLCVFT